MTFREWMTNEKIKEHIKEYDKEWAKQCRREYLQNKYKKTFDKLYKKSKRYVADLIIKLQYLNGADTEVFNYRKIELRKEIKRHIRRYIRRYRGNKELDVGRAKDYPFSSLMVFDAHNMAKCPFHSDTNPSLKYYQKTNTIHCFSCNKSWDTIQYVMDIEGKSFIEAVRSLT